MKISQRTLRIGASSLLALSFVGIAYILSGPNPFTQRTVSAETAEELLAAYASKDSDADTLPDWQEALYGTDPANPDTDGDGISDGEAVRQGLINPSTLAAQLPEEPTGEELLEEIPGMDPAPGSITEQFGQEFLQAYAAASNGQAMTAEGQQQLITQLMGQFASRAGATLTSNYSAVSVRTDGSISVLEYASSVESILRSNDLPAADSQPYPLMQALIERNDESARPKLSAISDAYGAMASQLRATAVPPQLTNSHVALVSSFESLSRSTGMISAYEADPLGALAALGVYQEASDALAQTLTDLATRILAGGEPPNGSSGSLIVFLGRIGK